MQCVKHMHNTVHLEGIPLTGLEKYSIEPPSSLQVYRYC